MAEPVLKKQPVFISFGKIWFQNNLSRKEHAQSLDLSLLQPGIKKFASR